MSRAHAFTQNNCLFISASILPKVVWALAGCFPTSYCLCNIFVSAGFVAAFEDMVTVRVMLS